MAKFDQVWRPKSASQKGDRSTFPSIWSRLDPTFRERFQISTYGRKAGTTRGTEFFSHYQGRGVLWAAAGWCSPWGGGLILGAPGPKGEQGTGEGAQGPAGEQGTGSVGEGVWGSGVGLRGSAWARG